MIRTHLTRRGVKVAIGSWLVGLGVVTILEIGAGQNSLLVYGGSMAGMLMGLGVGALISGNWRERE